MIVLDSHIWFWFVNMDHDRFPASWTEMIETADRVSISPVSCYELALAHQRGRLLLPCTAQRWFQEALAPVGIDVLPLTPNITTRAVDLSPVHKDPFDRIIIATALEHDASLASIDGIFKRYPELQEHLLGSEEI